jgi:hypothetical protein
LIEAHFALWQYALFAIQPKHWLLLFCSEYGKRGIHLSHAKMLSRFGLDYMVQIRHPANQGKQLWQPFSILR